MFSFYEESTNIALSNDVSLFLCSITAAIHAEESILENVNYR